MQTYVVKRGDCLSEIARSFLGDGNRWPELAKLNRLANPNRLLIGQTLQIPIPTKAAGSGAAPKAQPGPSIFLGNQIPASLALARGFMFVVFEQLPEIGADKIIRKVAAIPKDFSLVPSNPLGTISVAEHAMGMNPKGSPFLSASEYPFGAPSIEGKPLLLDVAKIRAAGGQIYSIQEVVKDLRRFAVDNPTAAQRINTLIKTIEGIEGEVLIKIAKTPPGSATTLTAAQTAYVRSAEDLWAAFRAGKLTRPQLEAELGALSKSYSRARVVGNVGRGLMIVGVVFTAIDVGRAADQSIQQKSFKPIGAEAVRQVGGWGGAFAGGKIGFGVGALFGIETGPGAIVTGAVGAIIFGAAGYFGADWVADHISPN
jgi:LysM repeat protein